MSSSFVGVLIPRQTFWKDSGIVDSRFKQCHQGESLKFRMFNFGFFPLQNLFEIFQKNLLSSLEFSSSVTISLFSTTNSQLDPEWNPKTKLENQDLLAVLNHKI